MTETIQTPIPSLFPQQEEEVLMLSLKATVDLKKGQEVRISNDFEVSTRTASQYPIGVVEIANTAGNTVTVQTNFAKTMKAIAKGGTIAPGAFVVPNGNFDSLGRPEYIVTTTAGDYALAIVVDGGPVDTEITLGILRTPVKI